MKMPQSKNPFASFAASFKEYIEIDNPQLKACNCITYANVHNKVTELTKQDLYVLAGNRIGAGFISGLEKMKNAALQVEYNTSTGKNEFTERAKLAIATLSTLAPANVKLVDYIKSIEEVANNTKTIRAQIEAQMEKEYGKPQKKPATSNKLPSKNLGAALFNDNHGITLDPKDHNGFDQQKALELLAERGVKVDSDQSLKTPNFEQEALKAVASLKNTVLTRAA
jgi:hypothetical protein